MHSFTPRGWSPSLLRTVFAFLLLLAVTARAVNLDIYYVNGSYTGNFYSGKIQITINFTGAQDGFYEVCGQSGNYWSGTVTNGLVGGQASTVYLSGAYSPHSIPVGTPMIVYVGAKKAGTIIQAVTDRGNFARFNNDAGTGNGNGVGGGTQFKLVQVTINLSGAALPQQAWSYTLNNSASGAGRVFGIYGPTGAQVHAGTVAARATLSGSYTPSASDPSGLYRLFVSANGDAAVVAQTNTLGPGSSNASFARTWSANPTSSSTGAGGGGSGTDGTVTNDTNAPVTTGWYDEFGNLVQAGPTLPANSSTNIDASGLPQPAAGQAATYILKSSDGTVLGKITLTNPGDGQTTARDGTIKATITPASGAPSGSPVAGTTAPPGAGAPTGGAPTGPGAGVGGAASLPTQTGAGAVGASTNAMSVKGDVNVLNTNDFYAPFKKALDDFGASNEMGAIGHKIVMADGPAVGQIIPKDQPSSAISTSAGNAVSDLRVKIGQLTAAPASKLPAALSLPTGFGSKYVYSFTLQLPVVGAKVYSFDMTAHANAIGMMRDLLRFVMTVSFWYATVRTIRGALGGS